MHVRDAFELFENLKNTTKCLSTEKSTPDSEIGHLFPRSWDTAGDKAKATSRNLIWSIVLSCPQEQGCTQQSGSRTQLRHKGGGPGWPVSSEPPSHPAQAWDEAGADQPARRVLHTCTGRDTTWSPGPHCVVLGSSHKSQGRRSQSCPGEEDASYLADMPFKLGLPHRLGRFTCPCTYRGPRTPQTDSVPPPSEHREHARLPNLTALQTRHHETVGSPGDPDNHATVVGLGVFSSHSKPVVVITN